MLTAYKHNVHRIANNVQRTHLYKYLELSIAPRDPQVYVHEEVDSYKKGNDKISELIVRNLLSSFSCNSGFCVGQKWLISVLNLLVNHQNTQLRAETKK